jgi:polynucleotide 5'-hydroxyl-kinase GRC3/NOL9
MSAVAAARLRAQQQAAPPIVPSSPIDVSASSELEEEVAEEIAIEPQRNLQLCTWRYGRDYVSSESDEQVTVSLNKNTTITLVGCFDFMVCKGAVNINGANFGAKSRRNQSASRRRAFVPSTHPISVIRGLDSENEVQFLNCEEPTPFSNLSPLFANIWNANAGKGRPRSFSLVGLFLFLSNPITVSVEMNLEDYMTASIHSMFNGPCTLSPFLTYCHIED